MRPFLLASLLFAACSSRPVDVPGLPPGAPCSRDEQCAEPDAITGGAVGAYCQVGGYCLQWIALPCYNDREIACLDHGAGTECGTCGAE